MAFVLGALLDPTLEKSLLLRGQRLIRELRRHLGRVGRVDALDELAVGERPGRERPFGERVFAVVESQIGEARVLVRPVTLVAVFRQDRPDVAIEANLLAGKQGGR